MDEARVFVEFVVMGMLVAVTAAIHLGLLLLERLGWIKKV